MGMQYQTYSVPDRDTVSAIYTDAMARMYGLVALGIVTTGAAIWIGDRAGVGEMIFSFGIIGYLLAIGVLFGTLIAAQGRLRAAILRSARYSTSPSPAWRACSSRPSS